ncbi:MAG: hypothetical protein ABSB59_01845 [Streptosporangiaceae bacterium]|jgi:glycosidase
MPSPQAAPPWWHGAVIYQLYVRSWRDSDGDGYGDLRGIIERLDHLGTLAGLDELIAQAGQRGRRRADDRPRRPGNTHPGQRERV